MQEQEFFIPIGEPLEEFKQHIAPEYNKRIIFSAPFGTGKTYFLDQYFNHRNKAEYNSFFLYPVNYSVSSNEDVFELIKFDILFQLLENEELQLQPNDFEDLFIAQNYLYSKANNILEWILKLSGKIGKNVVNIANSLDIIIKEYKKFKDDVTENIDLDRSLDYILNIKNKPGSAYEEDAITHLIQKLLQQLSENGKQSILIIDDLDRIDPEHIFRLLNVFAAHFDIAGANTNKFGVDKVIFVCDVGNVRNIFHAKYGAETDFTGYIDKFYSSDIFFYKNIDKTIEFVTTKIVRALMKRNFKEGSDFYDAIYSTEFIDLIRFVLKTLHLYGLLNLRIMKKIFEQDLSLVRYKLNLKFNGRYIYNVNSCMIIIFDILKSIYGGYTNTLKILEKASVFTTDSPEESKHILSNAYGHLMPILTYDHAFDEKDRTRTIYHNKDINANFIIEKRPNYGRVIYNEPIDIQYLGNINTVGPAIRVLRINLFILFIEAFEKLQSYGHLKD